MPDQPNSEKPETSSREAAPPTVRSDDLLRKGVELRILHAGEVYRLRITRQNKLILTK
jgi:hemin uptake protein HemP